MSIQNSEYKKFDDLRILILRALDGTISVEELSDLEGKLASDSRCRKYYRAFMFTYCNIESVMGADDVAALLRDSGSDSNVDEEFLSILAAQEDNAPELVMERPEVETVIISKPKSDNKSSKFNKFVSCTVAIAASILVFFIVYANVFPPHYTVPVASIVDSVDSKWENGSERLLPGDRIFTNQPPYAISAGIVKIQYNSGVAVIIEAPAEFQIIDDDELRLDYGRIFAIVPKEGIGFAVQTKNSRIIDLGTEFGVQVNSNGDTSLHVIKGKTMLVAGDSVNAVSLAVNEGMARRVSLANNTVEEIYCKDDFFVRDISSNSNFIWRGQDKINLADIIGGGNGFGTGQESIAIDPASGEISNEIVTASRAQRDNKYYPVADNPYIDGVFVPYGKGIPLQITSVGHIFEQCPETAGEYWMGISNKPVINPEVTAAKPYNFEYVKLDGIQYGTKDHPAIMMHANCGITFDLDEIRQTIQKKEISGFTAVGGISETIRGSEFIKEASVVLWILVDGNVLQKYDLDVNNDKVDINIALNDNVRFLTLISTDGHQSINCDWAFLGNPSLMLK